MRLLRGVLTVLALAVASSPALAGDILYVSDSTTDSATIPAVLSGGTAEVPHPMIMGAGFRASSGAGFHDVTIIRFDYVRTNPGAPFGTPVEGTNPTLAGLTAGVTLSAFDAVYWSASGQHEPDLFGGGGGTDGGLHTDPAVFTSLSAYVAGGGYVFVTGHDALHDPADQLLLDFVGGGTGAVTGTEFEPAAPTAISATQTCLTFGVVDIRGLIPGAVQPAGVAGVGTDPDQDAISGVAMDTLGLVEQTGSPGAFLWTIRVPSGSQTDPSAGKIAYVAAGEPLIEDLPFDDPPTAPFIHDGEDPAWTLDPAYNGALLNFAANCGGCPTPVDASLTVTRVLRRERVIRGATVVRSNALGYLDVGVSGTDFASAATVGLGDDVISIPAGGLAATGPGAWAYTSGDGAQRVRINQIGSTSRHRLRIDVSDSDLVNGDALISFANADISAETTVTVAGDRFLRGRGASSGPPLAIEYFRSRLLGSGSYAARYRGRIPFDGSGPGAAPDLLVCMGGFSQSIDAGDVTVTSRGFRFINRDVSRGRESGVLRVTVDVVSGLVVADVRVDALVAIAGTEVPITLGFGQGGDDNAVQIVATVVAPDALRY